jgi:hypothetical protein
MISINRQVMIIRPQDPYVKWENSRPFHHQKQLKKAVLFFLVFSFTVSMALICAAEEVRTLPVGSAERKAILDTMRADIMEKAGMEVVFVVKWLKVKEGWAWVETHPRSRDGMNRYEPFIALLEKKEEWAIAEVPPLEEDSPPVDDAYFKDLIARYPGLPEGIFPWGR